MPMSQASAKGEERKPIGLQEGEMHDICIHAIPFLFKHDHQSLPARQVLKHNSDAARTKSFGEKGRELDTRPWVLQQVQPIIEGSSASLSTIFGVSIPEENKWTEYWQGGGGLGRVRMNDAYSTWMILVNEISSRESEWQIEGIV